MSSKLILVIGATGAQGIAVINALLSPAKDRSPSPYKIRALTRDPNGKRAQALTARGVECVEGSVDDLASITAAFQGVYGAWVNTDSSVIGEQREIFAGLNIYEIARRTPSVRHYVWSNLAYASKITQYKLEYKAPLYDGKGRVGEFIKGQPSGVSDSEFAWSVVTTGPYMEMLNLFFFGPLNKRADGTFVFGPPIGSGHIPMIALRDLGFWARYTFDHRQESSGKELAVASELVSLDHLVETFKKVTGLPAVSASLSVEEWFALFDNADAPYAAEVKGHGVLTFQQNFSAWWRLYRDDVIANTKDMAWIKRVHPDTMTIERWMKENKYRGEFDPETTKGVESGRSGYSLSSERVSQL